MRGASETLPRTTRHAGAWIEQELGVCYQGRSGLIPSGMTALAGVEDLRRTMPGKRFVHGLNAKARFQGDGKPPGEEPCG